MLLHYRPSQYRPCQSTTVSYAVENILANMGYLHKIKHIALSVSARRDHSPLPVTLFILLLHPLAVMYMRGILTKMLESCPSAFLLNSFHCIFSVGSEVEQVQRCPAFCGFHCVPGGSGSRQINDFWPYQHGPQAAGVS